MEFFTSTTALFSSSTAGPVLQTVVWTNLGPLRTVFTAPTTCSNVRLGDFTGIVNSSTVFIASAVPTRKTYYSCDLSFYQYVSSGCIPYASAASELSFLYYDHFGPTLFTSFNSPGIHCPSGWQTVGKYTLRQNVTSASDYTALPTWAKHLFLTGGTHIICCPR